MSGWDRHAEAMPYILHLLLLLSMSCCQRCARACEVVTHFPRVLLEGWPGKPTTLLCFCLLISCLPVTCRPRIMRFHFLCKLMFPFLQCKKKVVGCSLQDFTNDCQHRPCVMTCVLCVTTSSFLRHSSASYNRVSDDFLSHGKRDYLSRNVNSPSLK